MYDSPKQLRRRQQEADRAHGMSLSHQRRIPTISDAQWNATCNYHIEQILVCGALGYHASAAAQAQAIVHKAVQRRAYEIMREYGRAYGKAMQMARAEMFTA
jgi:hypothetical protein